MSKYIKWELKNLYEKNTKTFLIISALFLLAVLVPLSDNELSYLVHVPFWAIIVYLGIATFLKGTLTIINTYKNKTFLLESMISYSPAKLLLTKYLLALILNVIYGILFLTGCAILVNKVSGDINLFSEMATLLAQTSFLDIIKILILIIVSAVSFSSLVVMVYIVAKCINPNKKVTLIISFIIWWIVIFIQTNIIEALTSKDEILTIDNSFWIVMLLQIAFIAVYYLITERLIKNKLEIYS